MPKTPSTGFWHQPRLWNCANAGMLVVCTCRRCQRQVNYLAADLVGIYGDLRLIGEIWRRCPRCGSESHWSEQARYTTADDVGHVRVRRPAGFRQVRQWRDEWYEKPATPPDAG